MRQSRPALALATLAVALAAAVGGYLWGVSAAPGADGATAARVAAARAAAAAAEIDAFPEGFRRGRTAGLEAGRQAGEKQGSRQGRAAGERTIEEALTLVKQRRAATAAETAISGPPTTPGSGGVLVVGDSLEVLTSPYLKNYLPHVPLTINVVGGYSSIQIFGLFRESYDPSQSVIVFDAGTNDNPAYPEILQSRLEAVAHVVGDRCMIVPTIHGLSVNGIDSDGKNRVVADFAASRPGTQVPDWAGVVDTHPELLQSDNLHPNPEGAAFRARLIARSVKECLTFGSTSSQGSAP